MQGGTGTQHNRMTKCNNDNRYAVNKVNKSRNNCNKMVLEAENEERMPGSEEIHLCRQQYNSAQAPDWIQREGQD